MPIHHYDISRVKEVRDAVPEKYKRTPDEDAAFTTINSRFNPHDSARAQLERRWHYNIAFTVGYQWHTWDTTSWGMMSRPSSSRWRVREVRNYIRPFVERAIASMTSFNPKFVSRPNSTDIEDIQATRVSNHILEHQWNAQKMIDKWPEACMWAAIAGTGFLKVHWNPHAGDQEVAPAVDPMTAELMFDEEGNPYEETYTQGDLEVSVPSPFTIHTDPLVTQDGDLEWIMEVTRRPLAWVDRFFPEKARYVVNDHGGEDPLRRQRAAYAVAGTGLFGTVSDHETAEEWVTVKEYYERPTPKYPKGRLIIGANNVILRMGDNPTPKHAIPYIPIRKLLIPGSFWGQSEVDDLIVPQKNYNRIVSKRLEHTFLFGVNAKVLFPQTAGIPQSAFVSQIGEVIKYNGVAPPSYLSPPPLPPESEQEMARFRSDFDAITSTYGAEKGQYQGKLSGTALNLLVEQGFKAKEPLLRRMAAALSRWAELTLENFQDNADEERIIKVQGKDNQFDIHSFKGADIRGNTDVYVEIDSMRPKSRTMGIQDLQVMGQIGLLNMMNPEDRSKGFKMLEMEDNADAITYDKERDRRGAQNENKLMLLGQRVPPPQSWENQDIHEEEHRSLLNSDEFKALPPEGQAILIEHYQQHLQMSMPQPGATLPPAMADQISGAGGPAPQGGQY